jgi:hypothetical protein
MSEQRDELVRWDLIEAAETAEDHHLETSENAFAYEPKPSRADHSFGFLGGLWLFARVARARSWRRAAWRIW